MGLVGCSIQAPQATFIYEYYLKRKSEGPKPNWTANWMGKQLAIYAINAGNKVIYATDEDAYIMYEGREIEESKNFVPTATVSRTRTGNIVQFSVGKAIIAEHRCNDWIKVDTTNVYGVVYSSLCHGSNEKYSNVIELDRDGQIIRILYKIHPDYSAIELVSGYQEPQRSPSNIWNKIIDWNRHDKM